MSFKQNRNKLKIIEYKNQNIKPKQGSLTLIWWRKGNDIDGYYIKSELYGLDGNLLTCEYIKPSLDALITSIKFDYNL